jgi:hypothetical protein
MPLELRKAMPVLLRSVGLDERWLQNQISLDPSILGLGELEIAGKEARDALVTSLAEGGIEASARRTDELSFSITTKGFEEHAATIGGVLKRAEEASRL